MACAVALAAAAQSYGGYGETAGSSDQSYNGPLPPEPASAPSGASANAGRSQSSAAAGQATQSPYAASAGQGYQPQSIDDALAAAAETDLTGTDATADTLRYPQRQMLAPNRPLPQPDEFEKFTKAVLGRPLQRFGASLLTPAARTFSPPASAAVPADYVLRAGDQILLQLAGSVEGERKLTIDREGKVFVPHVGAVSVAGVRYGDLEGVLSHKVGSEFRNFHVSVSAAKLHGIRVYVTGFAAAPGAYTVGSLDTLMNAVLAAGGPAPGGSFRSIQLRRNGRLVTDFDAYDLLLKGDKSRDAALEDDDVIYIAPVGPQVAITGSVNAEAIFEARRGETLGDMLAYAGGLSTLADPSKLYVQRLSNLDRMGWDEIDLSASLHAPANPGDILKVTSVADYARPLERQAIVVKIEGEVDKPGRYYLPPGSTLLDLLARAGGLTDHAFVFGSELDRVTVQQQQQAGFDQAIRNAELSIASAPLTATHLDATSDAAVAAQAQVAKQVISQLKIHKPDGRLILPVTPTMASLPSGLVLENDDRVYIPPKPTTVGVFGAVFQPGSFMFRSGETIGDYVTLAGGPQRMAQASDMFVVRANGAVISKRQHGWGHSFESEPALPGDVVFVPIRTEPNLGFAKLLNASQIIYQLGFGAAALKAVGAL